MGILLLFVALFALNKVEASYFYARDVSTDSLLELALTNYHRYHSPEKNWLSLYAKPFFMQSTNHAPHYTRGGILFTGYINLTKSIWVGINSAAMQAQAGHLTAGGLDDIQFKLAYDILMLEDSHATAYLVGTAPTGNRPQRSYEPHVGSKNGSFGLGLNVDMVAAEIMNYELSLVGDLKYLYFFGSVINCLQKPVAYGNTINLWAGLCLPIHNNIIEVGYEFWWRHTSHRYNINASSQKLYLDLGYTPKNVRYSPIVGLGGSYEFATQNALNVWTIWLTGGIIF